MHAGTLIYPGIRSHVRNMQEKRYSCIALACYGMCVVVVIIGRFWDTVARAQTRAASSSQSVVRDGQLVGSRAARLTYGGSDDPRAINDYVRNDSSGTAGS